MKLNAEESVIIIRDFFKEMIDFTIKKIEEEKQMKGIKVSDLKNIMADDLEQPTFTHEDLENGDAPEVGSMVVYDGDNFRLKDFKGFEVKVIGICRSDDDCIITFSRPFKGVGCDKYSPEVKSFLPVKSEDEKKRDEVEKFLEKIGVINYEIATDKIIDILK